MGNAENHRGVVERTAATGRDESVTSPTPRAAREGDRLIRVPTLADALTREALQTLTTADLTAFLMERRWFGAKAGAPSAARIRDVVPIDWEGGRFAVARVEVVPAGGGPAALYQLPLSVRRAGPSTPRRRPRCAGWRATGSQRRRR